MKHLVNAIDIAGIIWNHALALSRRYYRCYGTGLSFNRLQKHIARLRSKTVRFGYWRKLGSQAVQDVVQRLEKAYKRFFKGQGGFPRFKKVKKYPSFTLKQAGWKLLGGNKVQLLSRNYKFVKSRDIPGTIKTVTVKRDSMGRVWICFSVVMTIFVPEATTSQIGGFDFGLKTFLTNDEGRTIESPQFFKQSQRKIAALNRELSRKKDGSSNRKRAKYQLAKAHDDIKNRRRDWFFKLAHDLCDCYQTMYFETLNLRGMQRLWGR
ncbi:MAG: transposase, partial [Chloroflexota bacterium]